MTERSIFVSALEIADPAAREAYLDRACAGDARLRQKVAALLKSHEKAGTFMQEPVLEQMQLSPEETPAASATRTQAEPAPLVADSLGFLAPPTKPGSLGRLGHYEIQETIGQGGFGVVLKAFDEKLHRVVAIKVLAPAFAAHGAARKRFIREARTAAAVKNEHVVAIHGVQDEAQPPYLVMELIDGNSLQDKIDKKGPLSVPEILRIGMQTAEGLAAAHRQGLVHRDIKPANILLENGVERVKITDFGLARAVDDVSVTQSGTVAGTPMYMSPEQAEGTAVDSRSDLFSLGSVLYALCTGQPPFHASGTHAVLKRVIEAFPRPIQESNREIPGWLCDIIAKLHAKQPADRFQSAKEVADLLGQHLAHWQQPSQTPMPAPISVPKPVFGAKRTEPGDKRGPEKPRFVVGFMVILVFTVILAAYVLGARSLLHWDASTAILVALQVSVSTAVVTFVLGVCATGMGWPRAARVCLIATTCAVLMSVVLGIGWLRLQIDPRARGL